MKKIHKKIGAMALAGMVVAGGVAASGGSSHAASYSKGSIKDLNVFNQRVYKDFEKVLGELSGKKKAEILAVSESNHAMWEYIKEKFPRDASLRHRLLVGHNLGAHYKILKMSLQAEKDSGKMFHHIIFDGVHFLIRFK